MSSTLSTNRYDVGLGSTNIPKTDLVRPLTAKELCMIPGHRLALIPSLIIPTTYYVLHLEHEPLRCGGHNMLLVLLMTG